MIKKYKYIVWDWNGTLFNDVDLCLDIINNVLNKQGISSLSLEKYREIFGFPIMEYYLKAGLDFNKTSFEVLGKEFMDEYEARKHESEIFSNARYILAEISKLNKAQSVLSAYPHNTLVEIIKLNKLDNYFDELAGLDNIYAASKTELGKKLVKRLQNPPEEIVLIGDTIHDYEVANEMGVDCILIAQGHQNKERLEKCGVRVAKDLNGLIANN